MDKRRTIVVVGGALSGPTAAARARETDDAARIVLIERGDAVSYAVAGLPYHLSGEVRDLAKLDRQRAEFFRDAYDVEVMTRVEVTDVDAFQRVVATRQKGAIKFDSLVYAAGAASTVPEVPGLPSARNVFAMRNLGELRAITAALRKGKRVVVLGGGFFGVEAADGLLRRRANVTLVEQSARLLPTFGTAAGGAARAALERAGARVVTGARIVSVDFAHDGVRALVLRNGMTLPCDLVIVATGVRPRTELLRAAGARLRPDGSVPVDMRCRTDLPEVYACGVCLALPHAVTGALTWLPQAAIADKTAQVAGANAAGGNARMGPVLGTAIVRAGSIAVARTGIAAHDAPGAEIVRVHPLARDPFLEGATPVSIELIVDRETGTVLGAEAWGREGVDKRIDVLATAIAGGLDAEDLAGLDLAYAPPFAMARDAVNVAGRVAHALLDDDHDGMAWSPADLLRRSAAAQIVDLRPGKGKGKSKGAFSDAKRMTLAEVRAKAGELAKSKQTIVFLSEDGAHGYLAACIARARGVNGAAYLTGGMASWHAEVQGS